MENYQNLLALVRTTNDLDELNEELEMVKKGLYQVNSSLEKILSESVREKVAIELGKILSKASDKNAEVEKIIAALEGLNQLNLKIAFEPTEKVIEKIYSWVSANLGDGVVLNFEYDPSVLAGAEISFNGKYADLSLKKALQGYRFN